MKRQVGKGMRGAFSERKEAEAMRDVLNSESGAGTFYVRLGHGTYRYEVWPCPWYRQPSARRQGLTPA